MMKQMMKLSAVALTAVFLLTACTKSTEKAKVNIRMTDAPAAYNEVNVDVQMVEVQMADSGWKQLNVNAGIYNLLDLTNGNDTLIASGDLEPGRINQIRLVLGSNNTAVLATGLTVDLETPSAQQSGLKLLVHEDIDAGATYNFLLDFDAAQSIVVTGSGKYILKPTIKVSLDQTSGSISGVVDPASADPVVSAITATDTFSTFADTTGGFLINGLEPDGYDVLIEPTSGGYGDTTITSVSVTAGQETNIGTINLQ